MTAAATSLPDVEARIRAIEARFATAVRRPAEPVGASSFAGVLGRVASARQVAAAPYAGGVAPGAGATGRQVVAAAMRHLGTPYVWGGTDPGTGFDCSGLVQHVYRVYGVELPRVSRDQARAGVAVPSLAEALPGDLVAFGSPVDHIGIYAGDGKMVVAPHRGAVVRVQDVTGTPSAIRRVLPDRAGPPVAGGPHALGSLFAAAGARHGVSPALLEAVARAESALDPRAVSAAGAQGLMQLMPATARGLGVDPFDPAQAVDGAARLLGGYLRDLGSVELALAAYNAGPAAVSRYGGVPPYRETRAYVDKVVGLLGGAGDR